MINFTTSAFLRTGQAIEPALQHSIDSTITEALRSIGCRVDQPKAHQVSACTLIWVGRVHLPDLLPADQIEPAINALFCEDIHVLDPGPKMLDDQGLVCDLQLVVNLWLFSKIQPGDLL